MLFAFLGILSHVCISDFYEYEPNSGIFFPELVINITITVIILPTFCFSVHGLWLGIKMGEIMVNNGRKPIVLYVFMKTVSKACFVHKADLVHCVHIGRNSPVTSRPKYVLNRSLSHNAVKTLIFHNLFCLNWNSLCCSLSFSCLILFWKYFLCFIHTVIWVMTTMVPIRGR